MRPSAARPPPQEGSGRHAARTDIPPRRPYNDGASLPRQDRNATQGGASPRPCRPFSSRHSPWAGADGRTRAQLDQSGSLPLSGTQQAALRPAICWRSSEREASGPTSCPTSEPLDPGLRTPSGPETASPDADVWRGRTDDWLRKAGVAVRERPHIDDAATDVALSLHRNG